MAKYNREFKKQMASEYLGHLRSHDSIPLRCGSRAAAHF